jgi:large subunit ribosomal protein L7/L12
MSLTPEELEWISRLERQVIRLSQAAGIPYEHEAPATSGEVPLDVIDLAASGNKIAAIKRYREITGADLAAAKQVVDSI